MFAVIEYLLLAIILFLAAGSLLNLSSHPRLGLPAGSNHRDRLVGSSAVLCLPIARGRVVIFFILVVARARDRIDALPWFSESFPTPPFPQSK